ncbi:thioredoxin [Cutibacterium avidum]|nr:thioredoxin [Cutibacterium avidum]MCO6660798.1 thioredoxin [Cutibacterium avidum]MCO6665209.1 thioredoxin [Cutibacterium avidum]PGX61640.1 thioredoxin [Cutibacterium avidum]PGX65282.1 thioredoxin [Cutibacterium avidum]
MEIHDDEFQPGVLADKQPAVSDVLSTWRERYKRPPGRSLGAVIMARARTSSSGCPGSPG